MSKAEELIACLEGEIARRDAMIARLLPRLNRVTQANYDLRAELAEINAQGVVMPGRMTWDGLRATACNIRGEGWNACLDEVARLNAAPAAPAADAVLTASEWTKDADEWGGALNYAAWEFINECPEKSALLFNNTKGPLRAAIMKYAELVAASAKEPSHD